LRSGYPAAVKAWLLRGIFAVLLAVALVAVGGAASAVSRLPDLEPWHRLISDLEPRAAEMTDQFTLAEYIGREQQVFDEAREQVERIVSASANPEVPSRYTEASRSHPSRIDAKWNHTYILDTPAPTGGALLIHGLTDGPYSMRAVAERLNALGYYTVSLRMQGHGTVPGGLVNTSWEDWSAAVRMGARHVRQRIGPDLPMVLVGYSNGGALITKYALDALYDTTLPPPSKLILISPMIGVSPAAGLAGAISLLGPVVEKARWIDVVPEYNPYKYNSFPANAGRQTARLTRVLSQELSAAAADGKIAGMPPVLAFQSLVDTTVSTAAVAYELLDRLPAGRNELVLFDMNRQSRVDAFTRGDAVLPRLIGDGTRPYAVTLITNTAADTLEVSAKTAAAGALAILDEPLGLSWPDTMYSMSHVALPFPTDDPIYGGEGNGREMGGISLGRLSPRGEKGALIIPAEVLMRVTWNPFFPYLAQRVEQWLAEPKAP
jgi:alpha-beta hydrolase superfamily lysophospholipase